MSSTLRFYDASTPPFPPPEGFDGVAFYGGGDTPHVWNLAEIESQPARFRLPIFTRDDPTQASAIADGNNFLKWLTEIGAPKGCLVALDSETSIDPNYVAQFFYTMAGGGYKLIDYGSVSTVFGNQNPDGYYWGADWTNRPHLDVNTQMTQWESLNSYDESTALATLPFWDTKPPTSPPSQVPDKTEMAEGKRRMIIIRVTAPEGHSWTGTRTYIYAPGTPPVYVYSPDDEAALSSVLPVINVGWNQYTTMGGS